eukprot:169027-Amphidinium_carterae.1
MVLIVEPGAAGRSKGKQFQAFGCGYGSSTCSENVPVPSHKKRHTESASLLWDRAQVFTLTYLPKLLAFESMILTFLKIF